MRWPFPEHHADVASLTDHSSRRLLRLGSPLAAPATPSRQVAILFRLATGSASCTFASAILVAERKHDGVPGAVQNNHLILMLMRLENSLQVRKTGRYLIACACVTLLINAFAERQLRKQFTPANPVLVLTKQRPVVGEWILPGDVFNRVEMTKLTTIIPAFGLVVLFLGISQLSRAKDLFQLEDLKAQLARIQGEKPA